MPPSRIRQQLASEISTLQIFTTINSDTDSDLEDLLGFLQYINEKRYLQRRTFDSRPLVYDLSTLESLCPNTFKQICRTTHDSFKQLFNLVKDDPAFHNSSLNHQWDPSIQLATGLCRLGSNGNGAAVRKISTLFGFGYGTTVLYTARTIKVIIKLKKKFLTWPTITERSESSLVMQQEGFPGCIGFVNGTTIPLSQKPALDGNVYWDQKKRYLFYSNKYRYHHPTDHFFLGFLDIQFLLNWFVTSTKGSSWYLLAGQVHAMMLEYSRK